MREEFTCNANAINVVRNNTLRLNDLIQLRPCTVKDYRVQPHTVQKAEAKGELIKLVKDSASNLDDSKLGRLRGMRRRRKNAEITLNLTLGADGV